MGSECKHRYDITKSKRTRKPPAEAQNNKYPTKDDDQGEENYNNIVEKVDNEDQGDINNRKSLKQLINSNGCEKNRGRSSLGQHFSEEEKQLQVVRKQNQQIKLKGMMGRYVKVLTHLIKLKRDSSSTTRSNNNIGSRKNPVLHLTT